jgi:uncharacterized protein YndB with AHSA1/START domain
MSALTLHTVGDTEVVITRRFAASPEAVYRAHTDPKIIQQWLLGPDGWTMPVCINEPWPGGKMRYEYTNGKGGDFSITGEYISAEPFSRIVRIERMNLPGPTPDSHVITTFEPDGAGTLLTLRIKLLDAQSRANMLSSGMERGLEASYARLEITIAEKAA